MAQLKDLIVNGASRLIGDTYINKAQISTVDAPTSSGGTTYGPGSSGQVLKTNGTTIYWGDNNSGTVTQVIAGTGLKVGTASSGGTITTTGTINHINSVTAQTTQAVYPIKIDAQGHISAYGTAVSIPTKTSDLTNDSGFITDPGVISINGNTGVVTILIPTASSTAPADLAASAAVGTSSNYARADHVHKKPSYALSEITGASDVQAIEALSGTTGFLKKTAANTWALDTTSFATTATVATQASISSSGLITYKNSSGTSLFTLQLPLYNGGVS